MINPHPPAHRPPHKKKKKKNKIQMVLIPIIPNKVRTLTQLNSTQLNSTQLLIIIIVTN